jgi:two-component system, chemotaxis family, chemotaxis protein CheY
MPNKTLLIADDSTVIRDRIKKAAQTAGWEIVGEARDGKEAVDLYNQLRPLAMTLDLTMPRCDGLCAIREIVAMDPQAKIIVVSALAQKKVMTLVFSCGAVDFVAKPFDERSLVTALNQVAVCVEPVAASG